MPLVSLLLKVSKQSKKLIKIANVLRRKPSNLLNDPRNFNKIFRKNVTSESDKSDLKIGTSPFL